MITAQSSDGVLHQFPDGTDPGVINGVMKNYADANTAPPPDAAPEPEKSGTTVGAVKGFGGSLINSIGGIASGVGAMVQTAGSDLKEEAAQEDQRKATVLSVFDDMDQGLPIPKDIKDAQGNRLNHSIFGQYQSASPDQRAILRASITGQPKATQGIEATVGGDLQNVGAAESAGGSAISDFGNSFTTDEEKGRTSVKITSMLGGLIPIVGAAVAGGLPALIGIGGVQGYGEGYDAAKKAGQSDDQAATAGMLNGMVQGGLMAVPVHKALEVMDALPGVAKSSVLKAAVELAKSSGTMVGFSQLSTLADNAVAKATYDPDRDMMQGVGENIGIQAAVGAILPAAGAGLHIAGSAARRAFTPDAKTADTAEKVMSTPDIDTAIKIAADAAQSAAPITDDIAAGANALDQVTRDAQQQKLNTLFNGLNTGEVEKSDNDTYRFHPADAPPDASFQLKVWDENAKPEEGEPQPSGDNVISPELAALQRKHYGDMGVDVVYFENNAKIPFDGAVDPEQPNTIFLSNDPTRNAAQVAGHEVTHVLENTTLPDGTSLGDLFHQQVVEGLNATGRNYAENVFGATAPKREAFAEGDEGDAAHKAAVTQHLVQEIGADIGGEAPKFETFMPKVIDAVQQRYGSSVAKDILQKFLDGIKSAMETLRKFFGGGDGPAATQSQKWVDNLDAIHDTLARMQAERFGVGIEREQALLAAQKDRAARDRLAAGQPETSLYNVEENKPIIEPPATAPEKAAETALVSPVQAGGRDLGPAYAEAKQRAMTMRRWLGELDQKRRVEAETLPQVRLLRENERAILNRVNGVESRLTGAAADRLTAVRAQIDAHVNPVGDNPSMARVREAMVREHQKMADAAAVSKDIALSPRVSDETRDKLVKRDPTYAEMFKTPRSSERKIEAPSKPAASELHDIPVPERTFKTTPGAIATEHAAEVSTLEAEGTKAAAEKIAAKTPVAEAPKSEAEKAAAKEVNSGAAQETSKSSAAAVSEEKKPRALTTQHPEGEGRKIERALNGEETRALENQPQIDAAKKMADEDPARALRIAMRREQPPKDTLASFYLFELERRATAAGDTDMIEKLMSSPLAKEATTAGRLSQSFSTRDPQSAVAKIQEVEQAREAAAGSRNPGGLEAAKTAVVAKAEKTLRSAIRAQVVKRLPPLEEMKSFLNSIKCN